MGYMFFNIYKIIPICYNFITIVQLAMLIRWSYAYTVKLRLYGEATLIRWSYAYKVKLRL